MSTLVNAKAKLLQEVEKSYKSNVSAIVEFSGELANEYGVTNYPFSLLTKLQTKKSKEQIQDILFKKLNKIRTASIEKIESYFNAIEVAPEFKGGSVSIEWKKSANWGANPNCKFSNNSDYTNYFSSKVSGCGYDKESTAIAQAFNQCTSLVKLVLLGFENGILTKENAYGVSCEKMPFQGGVGTDCFISSLKKLGWNMKKVGSGKTFDCWDIVPL
jgi:hypothetical protein